MKKPAFIITIDTEGDNLWQNHRVIKTENARYLARFQTLCERFGFKPVWLTNYEMAIEPVFCRAGKTSKKAGRTRIFAPVRRLFLCSVQSGTVELEIFLF